jgi:hypothetical protein
MYGYGVPRRDSGVGARSELLGRASGNVTSRPEASGVPSTSHGEVPLK